MIRYLKPEDKIIYLKMCREFYASDAVMHPLPDVNYEETFSELMKGSPLTFCVIIEHGDDTVGYSLLNRTWSQEAGGECIWIEELFILPEHRGKGYGKEFFAWLFTNHKAKRYRLEVEPENTAAFGLYKSLGFTALPYGQLYLEPQLTGNFSDSVKVPTQDQ